MESRGTLRRSNVKYELDNEGSALVYVQFWWGKPYPDPAPELDDNPTVQVQLAPEDALELAQNLLVAARSAQASSLSGIQPDQDE